MLKEYEMIGSTKEDQKMNQIIKENKIKTRKLNEERDRKAKSKRKLDKIENFMIYSIFGILSSFNMLIFLASASMCSLASIEFAYL